MRCLKAFGERTATSNPDRQTAEIRIRVALIFRFNAFGSAEVARVARHKKGNGQVTPHARRTQQRRQDTRTGPDPRRTARMFPGRRSGRHRGHDKDVTLGVLQHLQRHAAQNHAGNRPLSLRRHDDQIRFHLSGGLEDSACDGRLVAAKDALGPADSGTSDELRQRLPRLARKSSR